MSSAIAEVCLGFWEFLESFEQYTIQLPTLSNLLKFAASALPISIALRKINSSFSSCYCRLPLLSKLVKAWNQASLVLRDHESLSRSLFFFTTGLCAVMSLDKGRQNSSDFVVDRLLNKASHKSVVSSLRSAQQPIYESAHELMVTTGSEESHFHQQIDAEIRRRHIREN